MRRLPFEGEAEGGAGRAEGDDSDAALHQSNMEPAMPDGRKSNDWRRTLVRAIAWVLVVGIAAATFLVGLHDDPSKLDEPINAMFDGIVRILTLLLGAGGVALGAYQSGRVRNGPDQPSGR
jgi:hypothetical protein